MQRLHTHDLMSRLYFLGSVLRTHLLKSMIYVYSSLLSIKFLAASITKENFGCNEKFGVKPLVACIACEKKKLSKIHAQIHGITDEGPPTQTLTHT